MDQGLVAVLGAAVGVLGGLGTSASTYVAARRQARDNGTVHHWQMLRDERKQAYLSFLSAVEEFQFEVSRFPEYFLVPPPAGELDKAGRVAGDRLTELYKKCNRVELAGPLDLVGRAELLRNEATKVYGRLEGHVGATGPLDARSLEEYMHVLDELASRQRDFVRHARSLLETRPA